MTNRKPFDAPDKQLLDRIGAAIDDDNTVAVVDAEIKVFRATDAGNDVFVLEVNFGRDQLAIPIRRSTILAQFGIKAADDS